MATYGEALKALKNGKTAYRKGWNGKGMFIWLQHGALGPEEATGEPGLYCGVPTDLFELWDGNIVPRLPSIGFRTAQGATLIGWLASQNDQLAEDWVIGKPA